MFLLNRFMFFFLAILITATLQGQDYDCIDGLLNMQKNKNSYIISNDCKFISIPGNDYLDNFKSIKLTQGDSHLSLNRGDLIQDMGNLFQIKIGLDTLFFSKNKGAFPFNKKQPLELTLLPQNQNISLSFIEEVKIEDATVQANPLVSQKKTAIYKFENGQNIFSDAKTLLQSTSDSQKDDVLSKYGIKKEKDEPFLSHLKVSGNHNNKGRDINLFSGRNILKTDVTNFATGMSRFLVDRAKAELNDAFFQRMYAEMDKVADLQFLFPQTYFFLRQINVHNIQLNLEQLKTKFEEDMKNLPVNLYNSKYQLDENKYAFLKSINQFLETPIGAWVDMGLYSLISNHGKINPKDLLESFVHSPAAKELKERLTRSLNNYTVDRTDAIPIAKVDVLATHNQLNLLSTIKLVELVSNSLLSPEEDRYWVPMQEVEELIKNDALFETYIGLLLAKSEFEQYKISFYKKDGTSISLKHLTESAYKQGSEAKMYLDNLKSMIKELFYTLSKIDDLGKELKAANSSEELIHEVYKYYSVLKDNVTILNAHLGFRGTIGNTTIDIDQAPLFQYLIPCIDIAYNIKSKQYNLAISNVITLLSYVQEHNAKHKKSTAKESAAVLKKLARYGTLIGSVAQAKTSDEVKAAIEASVLPVGSSRIKRHSRYSISLNAYVGAFYGQGFYKEEVNGLLENKTVQTFGITAPIGVSFNKGGLGFKQKSSLSLTMQVIDLGALVNFYAKNGDGASLPANTKIQLGDILAPGAQLTYSLGDSPFSIIGGIQYVPNLSRMSEISSNTNFTPIAYRAQIGLVIDIPLFNLKVWEK